tara:strand:+ start:8127 stop:8300 length:174 start_codon:yes stop_codon:yes gene_type:complete
MVKGIKGIRFFRWQDFTQGSKGYSIPFFKGGPYKRSLFFGYAGPHRKGGALYRRKDD